jgi:hypothetical protein
MAVMVQQFCTAVPCESMESVCEKGYLKFRQDIYQNVGNSLDASIFSLFWYLPAWSAE